MSAIGGPSVTIKSHHNVGGLPARMRLKLVEPLRELFKDEVRELGRELGLPERIVDRHPFPVRVWRSVFPAKSPATSSKSCARQMRCLSRRSATPGCTARSGRPFVVLLPIRSVGVMGDARSYDYACALRAVTSTDGMTADTFAFSDEFLGRAATRIINEVRGINRVVYDVTSKPPGTIEWE